MNQLKFVEDSVYKILLGPFLNNLSHIYVHYWSSLNTKSESELYPYNYKAKETE